MHCFRSVQFHSCNLCCVQKTPTREQHPGLDAHFQWDIAFAKKKFSIAVVFVQISHVLAGFFENRYFFKMQLILELGKNVSNLPKNLFPN